MEAYILDDLINIDCVYFVQMGDQIYHTPLTHTFNKKTYASDIETSFFLFGFIDIKWYKFFKT